MSDTQLDKPEQQLAYYLSILDRCWTASRHYKDDSSKLLIWNGSLLVAVVVITGIFGSVNSKNILFSFTLIHALKKSKGKGSNLCLTLSLCETIFQQPINLTPGWLRYCFRSIAARRKLSARLAPSYASY